MNGDVISCIDRYQHIIPSVSLKWISSNPHVEKKPRRLTWRMACERSYNKSLWIHGILKNLGWITQSFILFTRLWSHMLHSILGSHGHGFRDHESDNQSKAFITNSNHHVPTYCGHDMMGWIIFSVLLHVFHPYWREGNVICSWLEYVTCVVCILWKAWIQLCTLKMGSFVVHKVLDFPFKYLSLRACGGRLQLLNCIPFTMANGCLFIPCSGGLATLCCLLFDFVWRPMVLVLVVFKLCWVFLVIIDNGKVERKEEEKKLGQVRKLWINNSVSGSLVVG